MKLKKKKKKRKEKEKKILFVLSITAVSSNKIN
jgi:hypothetical protein